MNKLYGLIEYSKEVKASRLVVDNDYLVKSAFAKEANKVAKELNGRLVTISYFNN